ncbi:luciferase-like protein [Rubrobacter xylanophilus DSM 9941]|uniref:Luciferase-like protein n=1 Tax=Rubrobacter xylanophilus (strain DSM 9941 / JCM 11954 / NBRC 16129 / PRD-1) TaxID=266117 RepID=Q1AZ33_RUBXD|nr:LLM class F420-dependent oxidoreductase [Rubrobacter xylanophilus]ABG03345.1 luciferase-like protein [Rubrobacter xylanophilus DSM 9941]
MHFGVVLQHFREHASPEAISEVARVAEELGYDSVWVMDHVVVPDVPEARQFTPLVYDPLLTLAYVAAKTGRVRLGTSVLVVPYRSPLVQAKMLSTLDALCGGRLILGVGAGWLPQEFEALGVPFRGRGSLMDEYLEAMRVLWTSEGPASFRGPTVRFENVFCEPKPVQRPHPPLWVGGGSEGALRRAARLGAAWHPSSRYAGVLAEKIEHLRRLSAAEGREPPPVRMRATLRLLPEGGTATERGPLIGTPEEVRASIRAYAAMGVSGFVLDAFYGSPPVEHKGPVEVVAALRDFAGKVMPEFRERPA